MSDEDTYASLDDLRARLDWELDPYEERMAQAALEDASDLARYHGRAWPTDGTAPRLVRTLVLKACKRYMTNPEGYTQSRAGDETVMWNDRSGENAGTVYFTISEQDLLRDLANRKGGLQTTQVVAWNSQVSTEPGYVPSGSGDEKPFPLFPSAEDNW